MSWWTPRPRIKFIQGLILIRLHLWIPKGLKAGRILFAHSILRVFFIHPEWSNGVSLSHVANRIENLSFLPTDISLHEISGPLNPIGCHGGWSTTLLLWPYGYRSILGTILSRKSSYFLPRSNCTEWNWHGIGRGGYLRGCSMPGCTPLASRIHNTWAEILELSSLLRAPSLIVVLSILWLLKDWFAIDHGWPRRHSLAGRSVVIICATHECQFQIRAVQRCPHSLTLLRLSHLHIVLPWAGNKSCFWD